MALGIIIGFVVGAITAAYFMAAPLTRLSEDERNDIVRKIRAAGRRRSSVTTKAPYSIRILITAKAFKGACSNPTIAIHL